MACQGIVMKILRKAYSSDKRIKYQRAMLFVRFYGGYNINDQRYEFYRGIPCSCLSSQSFLFLCIAFIRFVHLVMISQDPTGRWWIMAMQIICLYRYLFIRYLYSRPLSNNQALYLIMVDSSHKNKTNAVLIEVFSQISFNALPSQVFF